MSNLPEETSQHILSLGLPADDLVLGTGSPSSRIAIIAEFPGPVEVMLKMPLVGGSGRYLWEQLGKIGVVREQCYVTNVIKRAVIQEKGDKLKVPAEEMRKWHSVLARELLQLSNVRYLLILGNVALEAIIGHKGIKKWAGSVLNFTPEMGFKNSGQALITYNPAFVFHDPQIEVSYIHYMRRFRRVLEGTFVPHTIKAHYNLDKRAVLDLVRRLRSEQLPISFDIETVGGETACIGLANNNHEGYCINFRDGENTSIYDITDEMAVRLALAEMFNDPKMFFVAQNGNFDSYWLRFKDRIRAPVHYDTLLAHHTLYPTLPHSLAYLTTAYTEHPYYKDDKDDWRAVGDISKFWEYNVKDCCITRTAYYGTLKELREQNLEQFFFNHVMRLQSHLVTMTVNGILIDQDLRSEISKDLTTQLEQLRADFTHKLQVATGEPGLEVNPLSPQQLREVFFNKLKLVGQGTSTDEDNRKRFKLHPNTSEASKDMLNSLDRFKEEHKFFSTYVDTKIDDDGRMRCEYRQWGTQSAPGRLSSSSVMWGSGTNLQNQPDRARPMFVAPPGYGFVYFDLSQAEARYVAYAWGIKGLIEAFELAELHPGTYDIHRLNASRIFNKPYDEIPLIDFDEHNKPTLRYQGKRSVHGFNYRLMPETAATKFNVTLAEATRAHRLYHAAFPEIGLAWQDIRKRVERDKVLFNAYGRRWILLSRLDDDEALDSIVAFEPQSSIGDKVCEVIYLAHEDKEWPRSSYGLEAAVTLNIHDALIAIARLEYMGHVASLLHKHATKPLIIRNREIVIPAEVGLSQPDKHGIHRWSTIKKVKYIDGAWK